MRTHNIFVPEPNEGETMLQAILIFVSASSGVIIGGGIIYGLLSAWMR
jgi:hypothetical protein